MNSAEQEEINRLNEQLEAVTQRALEATADAKMWMGKYQKTLTDDETASDVIQHLKSTVEILQRTNVKLENRIDTLIDALALVAKRENRGY